MSRTARLEQALTAAVAFADISRSLIRETNVCTLYMHWFCVRHSAALPRVSQLNSLTYTSKTVSVI